MTVNGESIEIRPWLTLQQWANQQQLPLETAIIEYNGEILPQEQWGNTTLCEGDTLEIFKFVGGG